MKPDTGTEMWRHTIESGIPGMKRMPEHIWGPCFPAQEWCWPTSLSWKHRVGLHTLGPREMPGEWE